MKLDTVELIIIIVFMIIINLNVISRTFTLNMGNAAISSEIQVSMLV